MLLSQQEFLGTVGIWLLDEALDADDAGGTGCGNRFTQLEVAEAGRGMGRGDGKGQDGGIARHEFRRLGQLSAEGSGVMDHGIGRKEANDSIGIAASGDASCECGGGGRIALGRFGNNVVSRKEWDGGQRGLDLGDIGQDKDPLKGNNSLKPPDGLFQKGLVTQELQQVLWGCGTAGRPESLATTSCHDENVEAID